jgi:hypothetical protein
MRKRLVSAVGLALLTLAFLGLGTFTTTVMATLSSCDTGWSQPDSHTGWATGEYTGLESGFEAYLFVDWGVGGFWSDLRSQQPDDDSMLVSFGGYEPGGPYYPYEEVGDTHTGLCVARQFPVFF